MNFWDSSAITPLLVSEPDTQLLERSLAGGLPVLVITESYGPGQPTIRS
jgi:hypothetical protein